MATTFGILAAVIVSISIWIGYKNSQAKAEQIEHVAKEENAKKANTATRNKLDKEIDDFKTKFAASLEKMKTQMDDKDEKEDEVVDLTQESDDLSKEIKDLEDQRDDYEAKVAEYGKPDKLIKELQDAKAAIVELDAEIDSLKKENDELTVRINSTNETIAFNSKVMKNHELFQAQEFLDGKVKAVYKNWGFVVLNKGDVEGVTPRSTLLVKRGEDVICELLVKNATNTSSTAEILFDTMLEGEFVQVGDKVYPKPVEVIVEPAGETSNEPTAPVDEPVEEDTNSDFDFG